MIVSGGPAIVDRQRAASKREAAIRRPLATSAVTHREAAQAVVGVCEAADRRRRSPRSASPRRRGRRVPAAGCRRRARPCVPPRRHFGGRQHHLSACPADRFDQRVVIALVGFVGEFEVHRDRPSRRHGADGRSPGRRSGGGTGTPSAGAGASVPGGSRCRSPRARRPERRTSASRGSRSARRSSAVRCASAGESRRRPRPRPAASSATASSATAFRRSLRVLPMIRRLL